MGEDEGWPQRAAEEAEGGDGPAFCLRKHERSRGGKNSEPRITRIARMKSRSALVARDSVCISVLSVGSVAKSFHFVISYFRGFVIERVWLPEGGGVHGTLRWAVEV